MDIVRFCFSRSYLSLDSTTILTYLTHSLNVFSKLMQPPTATKSRSFDMIKQIKKIIKKIVSYPDNTPSKNIFQELTYDYYISQPEILDDYLVNLYAPEHDLKFFSFR